MTEAAPARKPAPLSLAEQIAINALAVIVCGALDGTRREDALFLLRTTFPACRTDGGTVLGAVFDAARQVLMAAPERRTAVGGMEWMRAHLAAASALEGFFMGRAALAHDALQPRPPIEEGNAA